MGKGKNVRHSTRWRAYASNSIILLLFMLSSIGHARENAFRQIKLSHGISIDIPTHWTVLSIETRKNLAAASQAVMEKAELDDGAAKKEALLAVNATPSPTGAMVRVSATSPAEFTQAALAAVTPQELRDLDAEIAPLYRRLGAAGGPKIIELKPTGVAKVNGAHALVIIYTREGINGTSPWRVTQYKIPTPSHIIELTLSYRLSDAVVWRPILDHVLKSVRVPVTPR